jgi:hypothetical protein
MIACIYVLKSNLKYCFHMKRDADRLHDNILSYFTAIGRLVRSNILFTF